MKQHCNSSKCPLVIIIFLVNFNLHPAGCVLCSKNKQVNVQVELVAVEDAPPVSSWSCTWHV